MVGMAEMGAPISLDGLAVHLDCWCVCLYYLYFASENPEDGKRRYNIRYHPVVAPHGHVLQKEDNDWVKKYMEYEVEGARPRGRPKKTWREIVEKDCQAHKFNREDVVDRNRWRKQTTEN